MEIFDRLWSERKSFDYDGKNYKLKDAYNQPHGVQARPVLFNAGRSPRGREFAAKHCDIAFVLRAQSRSRGYQGAGAE